MKNKFIVNENKYGITYLGIGRKRTVNQMFTCLEKTALLPFFPYSTSSQIPLSSLLLPQVTLHPYSEPMHHMRLGNVCVCESYSQHIVVSSCHSLLFTFFLCSGVGSPYHCRREKYLSLNWVILSYSTFFFFFFLSECLTVCEYLEFQPGTSAIKINRMWLIQEPAIFR